MRATGSWTPDSRIADVDQMSSDFPVLWEQMARETYLTHQTYLGLPGDPVSFSDRYFLSDADEPPKARLDLPVRTAPGIDNIRFAEFGDRLRGTTPRSFEIPADASPFPVNRTRKGSAMQFNVTALVHALQDEFLLQGGRFETRTFHTPGEIAELAEKVVINCTGYGARALFNDKTMIPVRAQIAWLAPQSEADYGLHYRGVMVLSRSDGIVVQNSRGDMNGVGIEEEVEDRDEARATIGVPLGDQESKFKRLIGVETRVAMGVVTIGQIVLGDRHCPAETFRDVLTGHFQMDAAGVNALGFRHVYEGPNLTKDTVKGPGL
ncbi:hypothetical protein LTR94_027377, partial [Friedmanniomyces endolithicus]